MNSLPDNWRARLNAIPDGVGLGTICDMFQMTRTATVTEEDVEHQ